MDYKEKYLTILKEYRQVFERLEEKGLEEFIDTLKDYERIFLIGVGREGLMTRAFAMRLMHMGKEVHWIWDDTTPHIGEGDLLIATSGDGKIGHIDYICRRAKAAGVLIYAVTGSPGGSTAAEVADTKDKKDAEFTIALCAKTEGIAWFDDMRTGVDEFNEAHDDVYAYEINPEGSDAAKQNAMLEDLIAQGVDAICCVPVDAKAVAETLQKARDAGIVVITHEASDILDNVDYDLEAFDNDYFGTLYGKYLAEAMDGKGQYYAAVGGLGMTTHMQWFNSCVEYLKENHPDMELVNPDGIPGEDDNNEATAYDLAVEAIAAYPDLKGFVDMAASSNGIALALEELGRTDIAMVGLATPSQGGEYIKNGTQYRGLCWRPADAGYTACEIAYKVLKGEEITEESTFTKEGYEKITMDKNLIMGDAPLVFDPDNVDDFPF